MAPSLTTRTPLKQCKGAWGRKGWKFAAKGNEGEESDGDCKMLRKHRDERPSDAA